MKRAVLHLVVTLCAAGLLRADQTTESVQQALKDQGFYYGNVTGEKGAETTAAIRRYQIRNGLQVTGDINPETLRSLNVSSNLASRSPPTSKPGVTQPGNLRPDESSRFGENSTPRSPSGPDRQLETGPAFPGGPYRSTPPPRISRRIFVAEVQRQLISGGYYQGRIDGRYGPRTAFAVGAFQLRSGILPTGRLDPRTLDALGLSNANLAYLQPAPRLHETWAPVVKFKHGRWKVKWKKYHRGEGDEYGLEDRGEDRDDWSHGVGRDD